MVKRPLPLGILMLILASGVPAGAQDTTPPAPGDMLWLRASEQPTPENFTTYPPDASEATVIELTLRNITSTVVQWRGPVPDRWDVGSDDRPAADVWIQGLDRVVPIADPRGDPDAVGKVMVVVELYRGDATEPFAAGATEVEVDRLTPVETPRHVHVDLQVERETSFTPGDAGFVFRVLIPGYVRPEHTLQLHLGSVDTPSSVTLPGFPTEAFRAWEEAERAERACAEAILQKRTCHVPDEGDPGRQHTPAVGVLPTLLILGFLVQRRFNTIRCR